MPAPATKRKLVVVGDGACGKTSMLSVFALGEFPHHYEPTVFDNYTAEIVLDGKPVELTLWDTAGQEEYERLRPLSFANSHIVLICFSVDSPDSLDNVSIKWAEEVREYCGRHVPILLVACKCDLRDEQPESPTFVSTEKGQRMADAIGAKHYKECSALKTEGVDEVFEAATRAAILVRDSEAARRRPPKHENYNEKGNNRRRSTVGMLEGSMHRKSEGDHSNSCCLIL